MKRRDFIKNTVPVAVMPALLGGYSVTALGNSPLLQALAGATLTDNVLVLVQMNGGNDGLNMVIPLDQYSNLSNARSNILIPSNKVLSLTGTSATGLHPAMTGLRDMFNNGVASIVQGVCYPTPNFSHFRATDIWLTASDSKQVLNTGWAGRYLANEYPNFPTGYPNATMPDPLAIQIGSTISSGFQGPITNMGMAISDPTNFYNLVTGVQDPAPNTHAGKELTYVRTVAQQTQQYSAAIKAAALKVTSQNPYPTNNSLADQLKIVARLIAGGLKTRIYMVSTGGYDTHSVQVQSGSPELGSHAVLLQRLSDAIKAFHDDCKFLGIHNRVMGMTFSEFGRRVKSNASLGTDHGAAAPLFVFGSPVKPGIIGSNPIIPATVTANDNVPMQYDFRSVYSSLLQDWFCVPDSDLNSIMLKNFQKLPLVANACTPVSGIHEQNQQAGINLISNYPNPFVSSTTITFETQGGHTLVEVYDMTGRSIKVLVDGDYEKGTYTTTFNGHGLPPGNYYARLQNGPIQQVRAMMIVR